jgi:outer membrane lipoprotein SlyB
MAGPLTENHGLRGYNTYVSFTRKIALVIASMLPLSSCTYQQVNDVSLFKYRKSDDVADVAMKTAGNIVPWTLEAAAAGVVVGTVGAVILGFLYLQSQAGQSGPPPSP